MTCTSALVVGLVFLELLQLNPVKCKGVGRLSKQLVGCYSVIFVCAVSQ